MNILNDSFGFTKIKKSLGLRNKEIWAPVCSIAEDSRKFKNPQSSTLSQVLLFAQDINSFSHIEFPNMPFHFQDLWDCSYKTVLKMKDSLRYSYISLR